jgi:hypothetical protein
VCMFYAQDLVHETWLVSIVLSISLECTSKGWLIDVYFIFLMCETLLVSIMSGINLECVSESKQKTKKQKTMYK